MVFQKNRTTSKFTRYTLIRFFPILIVILFPKIQTQASAIDTAVAFAVGYDDNVTLSPVSKNSAFARYQAYLARNFFSDGSLADFKGYIGAQYQDYFSAGDNYYMYAGASLGYPVAEGRLVPELYYEGTIFRDDELPEDSMNEHCLGGRLDWFPQARIIIGLRQSWCWQDYRDKEGPEVSGKQKGMNGQTGHDELESRDDRLSSTGLMLHYSFTPQTDAEILFTHDRSSSSIERESYSENGLALSLLWTPMDHWEFSGRMGWGKTDYDRSPQDVKRQDKTWRFGVEIGRIINKYKIFARYEKTDNDSSIDEETYKNMVTQCGVSCFF